MELAKLRGADSFRNAGSREFPVPEGTRFSDSKRVDRGIPVKGGPRIVRSASVWASEDQTGDRVSRPEGCEGPG